MAAEVKQQSTARKDLLHQIELDVQKKWEEEKVFETDAPDEKCEKFMVTFPIPYMNGLLHIGHGFTLTKAMFAAHFHRLLGKKVIFPFGFHCTGMPINAAADKLKREFAAFGAPYPTFPSGRPLPCETADGFIELDDSGRPKLQWKSPSSTGQRAIKVHRVLMKEKDGDFKEVASIPHPDAEALKEQKGKVIATVPIGEGRCVYKIVVELADGTSCPESKESDELSVDAPLAKAGAAGGKKVAKKILAKTGDAATQWEILFAMGIKPEDMANFTDPNYWVEYYPALCIRDLKRFGTPVDFRRSFITTPKNPYFDSFIRWQFRHLRKADKIGFGKRPTIYSETDQQACMDHERAEGEGVAPQEYTAIKLEIIELPKVMKTLKGKRVFLLGATLRAETMPGQTNCWILPEGDYGCFKAKDDEVYVCSHRAARNMSFQDILAPWAKPECLLEVKGKDIMGCKLKAPTAAYDCVYLLPLPTIKMDKGTGIVTSVPSDSPDDYAALMDLMKPGKRDFYKVKEEWVLPFKPVSIIEVEMDGEKQHMAAEYMCNKLGVQSVNDRVKLAEAHDTVYKLGFDRGVMTTGPCKGQPVKKAKIEMRNIMIKDNQAFTYSEPEKKVVSRSGDECVVAGIDQWYLKYGEPAWRETVQNFMNSSDFNMYNDRIKESFNHAIGWLKEWACSRSFGLGTRVPWDEQFLVETLSDSTIYMAYYSVSHILQGCTLDGSAGTIKVEDVTDEVWDYIFINGPAPSNCPIDMKVMEKMRQEFRFWYPMDLRVSGKDLIQNHLTMALYNHAVIWEKEPEMWPRGYFCGGWLNVNGEKMSKSKGNFFTLTDIMQKYSADIVRLACANAGDTLEDANMEENVANKALLFLPVFLETMKGLLSGSDPTKDEAVMKFHDRWFANEMNRLVVDAKAQYECMVYREALKVSWFEMLAAFDQYRDICKAAQVLPNKGLVLQYYEWQLIVFSPICPHFCEHGWGLLGKSGSVLNARFPEPTKPVDNLITAQGTHVYTKVPHEFIKLYEKVLKQGKPTAGVVYVARSFPDWKICVLEKLRARHAEGKMPLMTQEDIKNDEVAGEQWKEIMKDLMQEKSLKSVAKHVGPFAAFKRDEAAAFGVGALDASLAFDEFELLKEKESLDYIKDKLWKMDLSVKLTADAPVDHETSASMAQPGKPAVHFIVDAAAAAAAKPAAKAGGGKAGGGGAKAAGGGAKAGGAEKAASSFKVMSDVGVLNEYMTTRSYVEGGHNPTAADAAQLAALKILVDAGKFPHAARWQSHISYFTVLQRSRW